MCGPWQIQNDGTLRWRPPVQSGPVEKAGDPSPSDSDVEEPVLRVARPRPDHPPLDQAVRYSLDVNNGRVASRVGMHSLTNLSLHVAYPYDGQVIHLPAPYMVKMSLITVGVEGRATLSVDSQASLCLELDRYERQQCLPRPKLVQRVCYMVDVREWRVPHTLRLSGRVDLEMLGLHQLVENGSSWVRLSAWLNGVQARPSLVWVDLKRHAVRTSAVRWRGRSIALSALAGERSAAQLLRRYARAFDLSWSDHFRTEAAHLFPSTKALPVRPLSLLEPSPYALDFVGLVIHAVTGFLVQGRDVASSDFTFNAEGDVAAAAAAAARAPVPRAGRGRRRAHAPQRPGGRRGTAHPAGSRASTRAG